VKTLKEEASIHEKFCITAAIKDKFRGTDISVPPEPSPSTPPPSSSLLLIPMMWRE
jgi:hypothetical protein